ncbi:MAG: molecular chaperone TorD family protein [bacterium]
MMGEMCTGSASHEMERALRYSALSVAFSYPDDRFFEFFPGLSSRREKFIVLHNTLFHPDGICLYGTEYIAENEFQRANCLADISGFYKAFGVEPRCSRPDLICCEFEFMSYLVLKSSAAHEIAGADSDEKSFICLDAQRKFFDEHLYTAATKIAEAVMSKTRNSFYSHTARETLDLLNSEKRFFARIK